MGKADIIEQVQHELRMDGQLPIMEGWTDSQRGVELAELVFDTSPEVIVEIGCFGGRSTVAMALALKEIGHGKIYTIDSWKRDDVLEGEIPANRDWWEKVDLHYIHKTAMEAFWRLGLDEYVVPIRSQSQRVANLFPRIDILNIDGNHSETASCRDVALYAPRVCAGGFIWMDDCDWESTRKAQEQMLEYCSLAKDRSHYKLYRRNN